MRKSIGGYMCKIAFVEELEGASDGTKIYPTIADLLEAHSCAWECGIVEVQVDFIRDVNKQDYTLESNDE